MGLPRFFKIPQHKRFDYQPIYFDPEKEEREERIRRIKKEMGHDTETDSGKRQTTLKRGSFREYNKSARKATRVSNTRIILFIVFLLFLAYFLFFK